MADGAEQGFRSSLDHHKQEIREGIERRNAALASDAESEVGKPRLLTMKLHTMEGDGIDVVLGPVVEVERVDESVD